MAAPRLNNLCRVEHGPGHVIDEEIEMKVRYYGHVGERTGYGRAASDLCMALLRAGVHLQIRPLSKAEWSSGPMTHIPDEMLPLAHSCRSDHELDPSPDVVIVHTLPLDCRRVLELAGYAAPMGFAGHVLTAGRPKCIAYTTWEVYDAGPATERHMNAFDAVWTPSQESGRAIEHPSVVIPHCFDEETLTARRARPRGDVGRFRFYYVGAWNARKNVNGLITAFVHQFNAGDPVELVIHSPSTDPLNLALALAATGVPDQERPRVSLMPGKWRDDDAMWHLHNQLDCLVSASHGEAWNLPAFEAMLAGRHMIVPAAQGSDDFLGDTSADLYPSGDGIACDVVVAASISEDRRLQAGTIGLQGLTAKSMWSEPNLLDLARFMERTSKDLIRDLRIDYDPRERYGYEAVGKLAITSMQSGKAPP